MLSQNEYGVFVLSAILENGDDFIKRRLLLNILGQSGHLALQKEGSKLIENCIKMIV
jgi:hypothetical protein